MRLVGGEIVYWTWHACPATCEAKFASISSIDVLIDFICVFRSLIVLFLSFIIDCRNSLCVMLKSSSSSDSSIEHWKPRIRRTRPSKMSIFSEKTFYQRHDIEGFRDHDNPKITCKGLLDVTEIFFSADISNLICHFFI